MAVTAVAVFFALGGTAIAARHYLITSTSQIKPSVLSDLRGKSVFPGPEGPEGKPGPAGQLGARASEDRKAWIVVAANGGEQQGVVEAIAFCASEGRAVLADKRSGAARRASVRAEMRRLFAKLARRWKAGGSKR